MALQDIVIGTANAGGGDTPFSAWTKAKAMFTELYSKSLYLPSITGYLGATGVASDMDSATAIDRIPTTSLAVGARINAIVTISGTQRRLYTAELVTPADATAAIELSPSVIRPNDFNASTNNKVWREIKDSGIIDVSNFGVVPDASVTVSDQINAIITAASAGDTLVFPPSGSSSYKCFGITVNKKLHFVGLGARIQWQGLSANMFSISVDGTTVRGFEFVGQGRNNATYPNQGCIRIASCSNVLISDCLFDSMPLFCIQTNATHISDTSSDFGGINVVNCHMMRSGYGFYGDTRGEYIQFVGCSIVDCNTGAQIGCGNVNFTGCQILDCSTVALNFVTGANDAHGVISGCQINHNTKSITGSSIVNGHTFVGTHLYFGDIELTSCTGFHFDGCTFEAMAAKFDGCTGIRIENSKIPGNNGTVTLDRAWNGNASTVYTRNNLNLTGQFVSQWNDQSSIATTDATVTTLFSVAIPASTAIILKALVVGRRTGGSSGTAEDAAAYEITALYKNVAGTATAIGSPTITVIGESQAGWDVTLVVSSGDVQIRVTGAANNNVSWKLMDYQALPVTS